MPQTETTASVGSPLTGQKTSIKFFSGDETKWLAHSYTNSLFVSNTTHPSTGTTNSIFGFRDGAGNLSYISQKLNIDDANQLYSSTKYRQYSSLVSNSDTNSEIYIPLRRSKDGYQYVNIPNALNTLVLNNSVVYDNDSGDAFVRPSGIVTFVGGNDPTTATQVTYTGVEITPLVIREGDNERIVGINNRNYNSEQCIPTNAAVTAYVNSYVKTFVTNNHYVTGSLTANQIVFGNGGSKIKTNGKSLQTRTITSYTDDYIPTNLAVGTYVTSKIEDVLGVSGTNISDLAAAIQQIDTIVNDGSSSTGILAYIRTNSEKIVALENNADHITPNSSNFASYIKTNVGHATMVGSMRFRNSSYLMDTLYLNDERKVNNWKTQNNMSITKKHGGISVDLSTVSGEANVFNMYLKHTTEIETTDEEVTISGKKMWVGKPDLYAVSYDDYGHISTAKKVETDESLTIKYKNKSNGVTKSDYDFVNGYIIPVICISDTYKEKINKIEEMLQYI